MRLRIVGRIVAIAIGLSILSVHAAAPQIRSQAPGYYRWMLGDIEITALSDGTFDLDTDSMLTNTAHAPVAELLARGFDGKSIPVSVNAYLVNTGTRLILIDTGAAGRFAPTLGLLAANLRASGYRPEQVDDILVTHMHPDHIGGLSSDGSRAFPNAVVHVERREAAFWLDAASRASAEPDRAAFFDGAVASMAPYIQSDAFRPFDGPRELFDGIRAIPAPGHTPGHTLYAIESRGQTLVIWGDLMELASIQFAAPQVTIVFDADAAAAAGLRPDVYADAAARRYWVAAAHLPFPGIGHVRAQGAGYEWLPITYDRVREPPR